MGLDVYTPAYLRMIETETYKQLEAEFSAYYALPLTVALADFGAKWDSLMRRWGQMKMAVGHFLYKFEVPSRLPPIHAAINDEVSGFRLTHEEVGIHVQERRDRLLTMFRAGEHREVWTNAFREVVPNPFQRLVWKYKRLCTAYRLGEGLYVR